MSHKLTPKNHSFYNVSAPVTDYPTNPLRKGILMNPFSAGDIITIPANVFIYENSHAVSSYKISIPTTFEIVSSYEAHVWFENGNRFYARPMISFVDDDDEVKLILVTVGLLKYIGASVDYIYARTEP